MKNFGFNNRIPRSLRKELQTPCCSKFWMLVFSMGILTPATSIFYRMNELHFSTLIISLLTGDREGIMNTFDKWGLTDKVTNRAALQRDLDSLVSTYYDVSLQKISLGKVIVEIFTIAYKHRIEIPSDIAILAKVILTLESVISQ